MADTLTTTEKLVQDYIAAWSTTDAAERSQLISSVYASNATFFALTPAGPMEFKGHEAIAKNIGQINERDIQGRGLKIETTGFMQNHGTVKVTWSMTTPDGNTAMTGCDVLVTDASGKITEDYIFIG